jgi:hypothetical protein
LTIHRVACLSHKAADVSTPHIGLYSGQPLAFFPADDRWTFFLGCLKTPGRFARMG